MADTHGSMNSDGINRSECNRHTVLIIFNLEDYLGLKSLSTFNAYLIYSDAQEQEKSEVLMKSSRQTNVARLPRHLLPSPITRSICVRREQKTKRAPFTAISYPHNDHGL